MKFDSKAVMAVVAVTLMIGCGLIPLTSNNANGEVSVVEDDSNGFTITDLIEKLNNIGKDGILDIGDGISLTAVEVESNDPTDITGEIQGKMELEPGTYRLKGDCTFKSDGTDNGRIVVSEGCNLVLLQPGVQNSFNLINENDSSLQYRALLVQLHSGAVLTVLGKSFMISFDDDGTVEKGVFLFRLSGYTSATSSFAATFETNKLTIKTGSCSKFWLFNFVILEDNMTDKADITASGDFEVGGFDGTIEVNARQGGTKYSFKLDTEFSMNVTYEKTTEGDKTKVVNKGVFSFKGELISDFVKDDTALGIKLTIAEGTKIGSNGNAVKIDFSDTRIYDSELNLESDKRLVRLYDSVTKSEMPLTISSSSIKVSFYKESGAEMSIEITSDQPDKTVDLIRIDNLKYTIDEKYKLGVKTGTNEMNGDLTINGKMIVSGLLLFEEIELVEIEDFNLTTKLSLTKDDDSMTIAGDLVSVSGKLTKAGSTIITEFAFNGYDIDISAKWTNFKMIFGSEGLDTISGNIDFELSTMYNGLKKKLVIVADGFECEDLKESQNITIDKLYLKNELPLRNILQGPETLLGVVLVDDMNIEFTVKNLRFNTDDHNYVADNLEIRYKNFYYIDEMYVKIDSEVTSAKENDKYIISFESATGYLKNVNSDPENFTIDGVGGEKAKVSINKFTSDPLIFNLYLFQGKAVFGKGMIPMYVHVMKDMDFTAYGLMAYKISFEKNMTVVPTGFVSVDTTDGIYSYNKNMNYGKSVYFDFEYKGDPSLDVSKEFNVVSVNSNGITAGTIVDFNISDFSTGVIRAKENYHIDSKPVQTGFSFTYNNDHKTVNFTATGYSTGTILALDVGYIGNGPFTLSYNGDTVTACYGEKVELGLPAVTENFIGWKDDNGKIAYPADGKIYYYMPARNVNLTAVYAAEVVPTISGDREIIKGGNSEVVILPEELEEGIKTVEIDIAGAKVVMDAETYNGLIDENAKYIKAVKANVSDNESVQKLIDNYANVFEFSITDENGDSVSFSGQTMEVTINVKFSMSPNDIRICYVDEYGHVESVGVKNYSLCNDGSFNITFDVNHFSTYAVEPIYNSDSAVVTIVAAVVIALFFISLLCIYIRHGKNDY